LHPRIEAAASIAQPVNSGSVGTAAWAVPCAEPGPSKRMWARPHVWTAPGGGSPPSKVVQSAPAARRASTAALAPIPISPARAVAWGLSTLSLPKLPARGAQRASLVPLRRCRSVRGVSPARSLSDTMPPSVLRVKAVRTAETAGPSVAQAAALGSTTRAKQSHGAFHAPRGNFKRPIPNKAAGTAWRGISARTVTSRIARLGSSLATEMASGARRVLAASTPAASG
jgi:hypothetical protein